MSKIFAGIIVCSAAFLMLSGCGGAQDEKENLHEAEVQKMTFEQTIERLDPKPIAKRVEAFDSYKKATKRKLNISCPQENQAANELLQKISKKELYQLNLTDTRTYNITLYRTENIEKIDTETFKKMFEDCWIQQGGDSPVKAYDDYLIWGWPSCSVGEHPSKSEKDYSQWARCFRFEGKMAAYLHK